jgi:hypothetical protein
LVASARRLEGEPFAGLKEVFERLQSHPNDRLAELLPDAGFTAPPNSRKVAA